MKARELKAYAEKLHKKLTELQEAAKRKALPLDEMPSSSVYDLIDLAQTSFSQELVYSLRQKDRTLYRSIQFALKRIKSKTYGHCLGCGDPIDRKRLDAVPWAEFCLDCQQAIEVSKEIYEFKDDLEFSLSEKTEAP